MKYTDSEIKLLSEEFTGIEYCPHCNSETTFNCIPLKKVTCKCDNCGKEIILCSLCDNCNGDCQKEICESIIRANS